MTDIGKAKDVAESRQLVDRAAIDSAQAHRLFADLASVIGVPQVEVPFERDAADRLPGACRNAAGASGASVVRPPDRQPTRQEFSDIVEIAQASRLRVRRVALPDGWRRRQVGPLIGWYGADRRPVAIVPASGRGYVMVEPETGRRTRVDDTLAAEMAANAAMLYLSLPSRP